MALTESSTIKYIMAIDDGKSILEKHMPGCTSNPMFKMTMGMTLKQVAGFPQAGITAEKLKAIVEDLAKM